MLQCPTSFRKGPEGLSFFRGADLVKSHSLKTIAQDLKINGELATFAAKLDLYYLAARYPDALPDHAVPSESFDSTIATEALEMAKSFLKKAKDEMKS